MARPYRIKIYDKSGNLETQLPPQVASVRSFERTINKPGKGLFSVPRDASIALKDNFQKYKRVKFMRYSESQSQYVPAWAGYIEAVIETDDSFEIGCVGRLQIFDKRMTEEAESLSGNGGTAALDLLDATNAEDDTGITRGSTDYTEDISMEADEKTLLDVWEEIATAEGGEFYIDLVDDTLNFQRAQGNDKTNTVRLIYTENRPAQNNLDYAKINESGKEIYTKIIGYAKASDGTEYRYEEEDSTQRNKYGLLVKTETYPDVESLAQLTAAVQADLAKYGEEIDNPEIRALPLTVETNIKGEEVTRGLDLDTIDLGDTITIYFQTSYNEFEDSRRIVQIKVQVDDSGNEDIKLKVNEVGQNLELLTVDEETALSREAIKQNRDTARRLYRS